MTTKIKTMTIVFISVFWFASGAQADLITIGTAQFQGTGSVYNLIWNDDNNGNSLVWLDFTQEQSNWADQLSWAAGLDHQLTINTYDNYQVNWGNLGWRLPSGGLSLSPGYSVDTSEMGHLFYSELGLSPRRNPETTEDALNASYFQNLVASWYWTSSPSATNPKTASYFTMLTGYQHYANKLDQNLYGIAVRDIDVSPVPEPGTILLLGIGIAGLGAVGRKRTNKR